MATLEQIAAALQTGAAGQALGISAAGTVEPITVAGGATPSSATPQPIGTATAGTSTDYSRGDHVHAAALADLSDVAATAPTSGQVLAWGGSEWAPATPAAAPTPSSATPSSIGTASAGTSTDYSRGDHVHAAALADLSDVAATAPTSGQVLAWSGTEWAPATASSGGPWQESGGIISPTTSGDVVQIEAGSAVDAIKVLDSVVQVATEIRAGNVQVRDVAGFTRVLMSAEGDAGVLLKGDTGTPVVPRIVATDFDDTPSALELTVGGLTVNGAAGTSGQVLTSNGAGAAPTWQAASGLAYIDHTINFTTTGGSAPNFTADHQVSGLDPSASYLVDSCIVDNVGGSATQLALCAATVTQTAGVSTPTTEQQAAIMGAWNVQLTISSLPPVDGLTGTYAGPRQGFGSSIMLAPAVVVTDSAGRLNLRAFTGTNGGSYRAKIRLRKVSA